MTRCHTVATSLESVVADAAHLSALRDAAERIHRITIDATELIALHVTRCLEEDLDLPPITEAAWVKAAMMEVSSAAGKDKRKRIDAELAKTRETFMPTLEPVDRSRLDQMLMFQATAIATNAQTNLWYHLRRRVLRLVRLKHPRKPMATPEERKAHKLQLYRMCDDLCKPRDVAFEANPEYHSWIQEWKQRLYLHQLPFFKMEANVRTHWDCLLRATWVINRTLEDAGERCTSCVPFRRQMRPGFYVIDTKALQLLLGIATTSEDLADRKVSLWHQVLHVNSSIKIPQGMSFACSMRTDGVSVRLLFAPSAVALQSKSRNKRKRDESAAEAPDTSAPSRAPQRQSSSDHCSLPRPGLYTIDQIKHQSRLLQNANVIGADPGKSELLVCARVTTETGGATATEFTKAPSVRYTSAQRASETSSKRHAHLERVELPQKIADGYATLSDHSSRSSYICQLAGYFKARRSLLPCMLAHFGDLKYRCRAWTRFRREQRSITDFVRRIKGLVPRQNKQPIVLAYGSWSNVAGRPGRPENKGHPPCIGKGLRAKLAHHFIVVSTAEAWTSQTCSKCGHRCGACAEVDARCRARHESALASQKEGDGAPTHKNIAPPYARGLRRCCNPACGLFLNRDHNAAVNIGRRCAAALFGAQTESTSPMWVDAAAQETDGTLDALCASVEHAF